MWPELCTQPKLLRPGVLFTELLLQQNPIWSEWLTDWFLNPCWCLNLIALTRVNTATLLREVKGHYRVCQVHHLSWIDWPSWYGAKGNHGKLFFFCLLTFFLYLWSLRSSLFSRFCSSRLNCRLLQSVIFLVMLRHFMSKLSVEMDWEDFFERGPPLAKILAASPRKMSAWGIGEGFCEILRSRCACAQEIFFFLYFTSDMFCFLHIHDIFSWTWVD